MLLALLLILVAGPAQLGGAGGQTEALAAGCVPRGGLYIQIRGTVPGCEAHHMPSSRAQEVNPDLHSDCSPAILMDPEDHVHTASRGSSDQAKRYRGEQAKLLKNGEFFKALRMDIDDIRDLESLGLIPQGKYDEAIAQAVDSIPSIQDCIKQRSGCRGPSAPSREPTLSADGGIVSFTELGSLVSDDTNAIDDVYLRESLAAGPERVSVTSGAQQANGPSTHPSISDDGRYVAFDSTASNLVGADTNGRSDIFVRDRTAGTTSRISVDAGDGQIVTSTGISAASVAPAISGDGRHVAFVADHTICTWYEDGGYDCESLKAIYVKDRQTGALSIASIGAAGAVPSGGSSWEPAISHDGRYVAFASSAAGFVASDFNGQQDVFVRDRALNTTKRASLTKTGGEASGPSWDPSISADGRYVAFTSDAVLDARDTNGRPDVYTRDISGGSTSWTSWTPTATPSGGQEASISGDGTRVAFATTARLVISDQNGNTEDIYRGPRDPEASGGAPLNIESRDDTGGGDSDGPSREPDMSADGELVGFTSSASTFTPCGNEGRLDPRTATVAPGVAERVYVHNRLPAGSLIWSATPSPSPQCNAMLVAAPTQPPSSD